MATLASCRPIARRRVLPAIVVLLLAVAGGTAQRPRSRIPPTGASRNVRDNLYVIPGAGGNTTVFVTQHGVVLVDTKLPNNGEAILNQVRGVTDKPVTMIINTHSHFHWFNYLRPVHGPENQLKQEYDAQLARGTSDVQKEYLRTFADPATIHAMCEDYRAGASIVLKHDEADLHRKIACPLLVLWGARAPMGRIYDILSIWKERAERASGRSLPAGHNLQEGAGPGARGAAGVLEVKERSCEPTGVSFSRP